MARQSYQYRVSTASGVILVGVEHQRSSQSRKSLHIKANINVHGSSNPKPSDWLDAIDKALALHRKTVPLPVSPHRNGPIHSM